MAEDDDFLSRWSRRKRTVVTDAPPRSGLDPETLDDVGQEAPDQVRSTEHKEPKTAEEETALLEKLGLPVPESLKEGDDFSAFMKAGVPEFLRKRALRVLWRSNPVLANLDGLNDYDDDFTSPELTQKVLATGYQVGRGFVKQVLETDEEPELEVVAAADPTPEDAPAEVAEIKDVSAFETTDEAVQAADEEPVFRPRRMRFET